jgi:anaerobic selenocysteine-containing dehydrogenase
MKKQFAVRTVKSFCRICSGFCGMDVSLDEQGRVVSLRGDKNNPATKGYACAKGLDAGPALYADRRILRPLKRVGDRQVPIGLEEALDEIAMRMRSIIEEDGPEALAFFLGTGFFGASILLVGWTALANAIGAQRFSTMTIDQSAKWVVPERLGSWAAPRHPFAQSDVVLLAGNNPLVSVLSWGMPMQNPAKCLRYAQTRGTKLIVIDPRQTETAKLADMHLQIYPGEDAAIAAGLIHVILREGWHDVEFCERHVNGLETLRAAVASFTPEASAARAGIAPEEIVAAARLFARDSQRGGTATGTGVNMAAFPNLAEHLYQVIGVICGRYLREGERIPTPGVLIAKPLARAQAINPTRAYESASRTRVRGAVRLMGEAPSVTLAEEILTPGKGRIRGLFVGGGNPASAIPDSRKVIEAFRALDLMVVVEPYHTETSRLADYVLPPPLLYEKADLTYGLEVFSLEQPYVQYTAAVAAHPDGSELASEGYIAWSLARRLGTRLSFCGADLDMDRPPSDDELLALIAAGGNVDFETLRRDAAGGRLFTELVCPKVLPPDESAGRFELMPADVSEELGAFAGTRSAADGLAPGAEYPLLLICRRMREVSNTSCRHFRSARTRVPFNPLCAHPDDLLSIGLADGAECWVVSTNGRIPAIVRADPTLKRGVVSMTHGFGDLADEEVDYRLRGASTSLLVSLDRDCEPLQAMPRLSGVPIRLEKGPW